MVIGLGKKPEKNYFKKKTPFYLEKKHLETTKLFYEKHGGKALVLGRFLPIIRTFAPIIAGVIKVDFKLFMIYNITGASLWIITLTSIAFFLGKEFPQTENYIGYIVIGLIVITTIPVFITYLKNRKK